MYKKIPNLFIFIYETRSVYLHSVCFVYVYSMYFIPSLLYCITPFGKSRVGLWCPFIPPKPLIPSKALAYLATNRSSAGYCNLSIYKYKTQSHAHISFVPAIQAMLV